MTDKGTLTLLYRGGVVLTPPRGAAPEQIAAAKERLTDWMRNPRYTVLVMPFPVEVIDQRSRRDD